MWEQVAEYWRNEVCFDMSDCFIGEEYPTDEEVAEYKINDLRMRLFNEYIDMVAYGVSKLEGKDMERWLRLDSYFLKFDHAQKMDWVDTGIALNIHNNWKGGKR